MLNCRQAALLISQDLDRELSSWRKALLYLHLAICSSCRLVRRQLTRIKSEAHECGLCEDEVISQVDRPGMPPELRDKLKKTIRAQEDVPDL